MTENRTDIAPLKSIDPAPTTTAITSSANLRNLLVSFRNRMVCTVVDVFAIIFFVGLLGDTLRGAGWAVADSRPVLVGIVVLYFGFAWASPLGATPIQFLWGIKVVAYDGQPLRRWRALVRGALVVAITAGAFTAFRVMQEPYMGIPAAVSMTLFFVAALTPRRQAAHDFLVRSLVVYRRQLRQPETLASLRDGNYKGPTQPRSVFHLRFDDLLLDTATLAVPLIILAVVLPVHHDKNLQARVSYALSETRAVKQAVQEFYIENDQLPNDAAALGEVEHLDYPDGGFYQLEANGRVLIHFTVKPELKKGSLLLTPEPGDDKIVWTCSAHGAIDQRYLPTSCRG